MATHITWHGSVQSRAERWQLLGVRGATLWFTGLSGSGKSTIAASLEQALVNQKRFAYRLDGDNVRHGLNGDLGFSPQERTENVRRIAEVAKLFADSGVLVLASVISPIASGREQARAIHQAADLPFFEIFVDTPLAECEARDPKGLYKQARAGTLKDFTGIDAPYEAPKNPDLLLHPQQQSVQACVEACLALLQKHELLPP